jgi:Fe-Mn family superoxide dismutase
MTHRLPELPYALNSLAPLISAETLEYHWGKHHRAYVKTLNELISGTGQADRSLEQLLHESSGAVFNNAAQHFNHSFYWTSLSPEAREPKGRLAEAIRGRYRSLAGLREAFGKAALGHFGSGWCWLVWKGDDTLDVQTTHDADCPLLYGSIPLLACDLWEHAYYLDYRNERDRYVEAFWTLANWPFAEKVLGDVLSSKREAGEVTSTVRR